MADRLRGRRILITGAAGDIGRGCAERFLAEGAAVALVDRDGARLEQARAALLGQGLVVAKSIDVTQGESVHAGTEAAIDALGGLDGLVNCIGIDLLQPFAETDWEAWERVLAVNLTGAMRMIHASLGALRASGRSAIVNIASATGLRPIPNRVAYASSKAGLIMATKALALDLAPFGIRANVVCPGAVETGLFRQWLGGATMDDVRSRYAMNRIGTVPEVAAAVLYLLSDEASFTTGATLAVDGGRVFH